MKNQLAIILIVVATIATGANVFAQGFTPPAESNAVVYFVRVTNWGALVSFQYFHDKKIIGTFSGKNYIRYECPAGESLLWASAENKEFLKCDLKAGETYVILVNVQMGAIKAGLSLEPVLADHPEFNRIKELVNEKKPVWTSPAQLAITQEKLDKRGFVENIMEKYEKEWKNSPHTKTVTPEMSIPLEKLI